MTAIGRRIIYLKSLDTDREQFWALLAPFLKDFPTDAETAAWYVHGELPPALIAEENKAREEQVVKEQQEPRRR